MARTSASSSFAYLTENTPDWITRLDDLTTRILSRQAELSQLAHSNAGTNSPTTDRNNNNNNDSPKDTKDTKDTEQLQKLHDEKNRRRKRKTASISSAASGSQRYRSRSMVIVYYDSTVQKAFETLVRDIGTARNNVRKAKMSARMKNWSALTGGEDDVDAVRSRFIMPRSASRSAGGGDEKTVYDTVDAALEMAQSQCETGAHQFLRDGDCRKEIEVAKKKLEEVRVLATEELEIAKKEEEKEKEKEEEEQKKKENQKENQQQQQGQEKQQQQQQQQQQQGNKEEEEVKLKRQDSPGDEGIEVDDDDDNEAEYQIPLDWKLRYARARAL
ncbi:hypothetical protein GP486_008461 [Trichoglossum hirsutum]|uniref:Uncharacterized protein n=1 Tax=Trichoglossum hirsutum TaxID=265104 RepID=A0A9P8I3C5_9PEZI|nr:hypothetical protein GP486_008461 [Trichoglossum hirsutum]